MANLLVVAAMAAAASGAADGAALKVAFGNTIVTTYPDGRQGQLWLHADGSYAAEGRRGDPSSGRWKLKGDKVCLKQSKPHAFPFSYCAAAPTGGLGSSWSGKAVTGEAIRIKLVKGMHGRTAPPAQPGALAKHAG
jgi:hypothetical protein